LVFVIGNLFSAAHYILNSYGVLSDKEQLNCRQMYTFSDLESAITIACLFLISILFIDI